MCARKYIYLKKIVFICMNIFVLVIFFFCVCAHECIYLEVLRDRVNKVGKLSHGKERACVCIFIHMKMHIFVYTGSGTGCLKLRVIFRKRATHYRALLLKVTYEDKAFYGSSPPCTDIHEFGKDTACAC